MFKKSLLFFLVLLIALPIYARAGVKEIEEYTVIEGDTLWDISGKELNNNFLWPKIWQENPEIENPDQLAPGMKIRIPLYLLREEEPVEEAPPPPPPVVIRQEDLPEPPPPNYLIHKNVLLASGYIDQDPESLGRIVSAPSGRNLFGNGDLVYVSMDGIAKQGDLFYVIRVGEEVVHPVSGKKLGYLVEIIGVLEIDREEYGNTLAKVVKAFKDVLTGDVLDVYYPIEPPLAEESYRHPDIEAYVVASKGLQIMNSWNDVVYLDKGRNEGLRVGDMLRTVETKENLAMRQKNLVPNGVVQIIAENDETSTAVVIENTSPVQAGNLIKKLD